jgi:methylisocitrate lyase
LAATINGFKILMVSSGDLAGGLTGIPDLQLLSLDEFVLVTDRITSMCDLPLIIDADDGFGRPLNTYYACQKLRKAGAAGVLITEAAGLGRQGVLPVEEAAQRFRAARDGLGPDGYLIARIDVHPEDDFEEVVTRSRAYRQAGADMICVLWMHLIDGDRLEYCRKLDAADPGPKWYPDLSTKAGAAELDIDDLVPLNYRMVGVHFSSHAAMLAMLDTGRHVLESRTNAYVDTHYEDTGYHFMTSMSLYGLHDGTWPELESCYLADPQDAIAVRNADYFVRPTDRIIEWSRKAEGAVE